MADSTPTVDDDLARAVAARREAETVERRLEQARAAAQESDAAAAAAEARAATERADVAALEHLSWSRIVSAMKGSHATDLERERAEAQAADFTAAAARARADDDARTVAALEARRESLGDVDAAYRAALDAKAAWAQEHEPATAAALARRSERLGELSDQRREADEAIAAGQEAQRLLALAHQQLGSARGWSNWDTFGGGGFFTDMAKHRRMDEAQATLRELDRSLVALDRELADVNRAGIVRLRIPPLLEVFDVFFDNLFSDLAVRRRLIDADDAVVETAAAVAGVLAQVTELGEELDRQIAAVAAERAALLGG